ncbi:MAG: hypothetical protein N2Z59_08560, partial [Alteraurantiacibacter sp.]|nr:hypothetical protein [Alteraurantiacibacter sp.]
DASLWPHVLALGWQALCVGLFIHAGASLFRRRVMQSGPAGGMRRSRSLKAWLSGVFRSASGSAKG